MHLVFKSSSFLNVVYKCFYEFCVLHNGFEVEVIPVNNPCLGGSLCHVSLAFEKGVVEYLCQCFVIWLELALLHVRLVYFKYKKV